MAANFTGLERACGRRINRFHRDRDRAIISLSPASVTEHTLQDGADYDDRIVETPAFLQRLSAMENPSVGTIKFASRRRHNSVLVAWGDLEEIVSIKTDALVWKPYEAREGNRSRWAQKKPKKAREGKSQESANDRNGDVEEAGGAEEDCEEEDADEGKDTVSEQLATSL
ncbi:hypothetical protein JCM10295v2_006995 [Rhodotorula toruloides]